MTDLTKEIAEFIDTRIKKGVVTHPEWVTQQILASHDDIEGDDSDFYTCVSRVTIYDQVRKRINRFKLTPEKGLQSDSQIVLPGFDRLQIAYVIEVNGEQAAIPLKRMYSSQRQSKISELIAMGEGCFQHAEELRRYDEEHPNPSPMQVIAARQ